MAEFPLKTHKHAKVAIDEQSRSAKNAMQFLVEHRDVKEKDGDGTCPITKGNKLSFIICGEEGFKRIAKDLRDAKQSADIICWGFDPGMELEREGENWPRGQTYGQLLDEITKRKEHPVTVRLLIWSTPRGSAVQNNMPGFSDVQENWTSGPIVYHLRQGPAYGDEKSERHKTCVAWWAENLPGGKSNSGKNPRLRVVLREVSPADAKALMTTAPAEEDKPVTSTFSVVDERSGMEDYGTHHQKPILIDYDYDNGSKAVGYVMGLNSVTDYWDRTAHEIDDRKREILSSPLIEDELKREIATQTAPVKTSFPAGMYQGLKNRFSKNDVQHGIGHENYTHGRPFQDYACRIVGPALAQLHFNFENAWAAALQVGELPYQTPPAPPAKIPRVAGNPAHLVQIVRTQPHEREKSIKEVYFQATSSARNYIYMENQYFFYPEFARHLIKTRKKHCDDWMKEAKKPVTEMPKLHLFIVIPHPEREEMVPRTYDTLTLLGAGDSMSEQKGLVDKGKLDFVYGKSSRGRGEVLDRPSVENLEKTLGVVVSVARLRTSGPDADKNMSYREIYIHSKLMIIDDVFITVGSANLNQRSMAIDSEINIAATGSIYAVDLRERVFELLYGGDIKYSGQPKDMPDAFRNWNRRMSKNQDIQQAGTQPMTGFLLPFVEHRSTTTLYGSISVPSGGGVGGPPENVYA